MSACVTASATCSEELTARETCFETCVTVPWSRSAAIGRPPNASQQNVHAVPLLARAEQECERGQWISQRQENRAAKARCERHVLQPIGPRYRQGRQQCESADHGPVVFDRQPA